MATIPKKPITALQIGDPGDPDVANQPHLDLEENIDRLRNRESIDILDKTIEALNSVDYIMDMRFDRVKKMTFDYLGELTVLCDNSNMVRIPASSRDVTALSVVPDSKAYINSTDFPSSSPVFQDIFNDEEVTGVTGGTTVGVGSNGLVYYSTDNGASWTEATHTATGVNFKGVYSDGSTWVAVGSGGAIISSADGITWTTRVSPLVSQLNSVHHDAIGVWVVGGDQSNVATSPDGITWTDRTFASQQPFDNLVYGGGTWVGSGFAGAGLEIYTSTDSGANWTGRASSYSRTGSVVYESSTGDFWCVTGGTTASPIVIRSIDLGVTWTFERTLTDIQGGSGAEKAVFNSVTGEYVIGITGTLLSEYEYVNDAADYDGHAILMTTTDFVNFQKGYIKVKYNLSLGRTLTQPITNSKQGSGFKMSMLLGGAGHLVEVSGSQKHWKYISKISSNNIMYQLTPSNSSAVTTTVYTTNVGTASIYREYTLRQAELVAMGAGAGDSSRMAWNPFEELLMVTTTGNDVLTSTDFGLTFTDISIAAAVVGTIASFEYINGRFIIISSESIRYSDDDGATWNSATVADGIAANGPQLAKKIAHNNQSNTTLYIDSNGVNAHRLFYSNDNGTTFNIILDEAKDIQSDGNGTWVAACKSSVLVYSLDDGITWQSAKGITATEQSDLQTVHYANGVWMVSGTFDSASSGTTQGYKSTDGITWTPIIIDGAVDPIDISEISYGGGTWIALSSLGVPNTSTDDGLTWTAQTSPEITANARVLHDQSGLWVIVGADKIITSPDGITWTSRTNPLTLNLLSVGYSSSLGLWIIGNSDTSVASSPDGITWTDRGSVYTGAVGVNEILYNPIKKIFIAVGNEEGNSARISVSKDGITWTQYTWSSSGSYSRFDIDLSTGKMLLIQRSVGVDDGFVGWDLEIETGERRSFGFNQSAPSVLSTGKCFVMQRASIENHMAISNDGKTFKSALMGKNHTTQDTFIMKDSNRQVSFIRSNGLDSILRSNPIKE